MIVRKFKKMVFCLTLLTVVWPPLPARAITTPQIMASALTTSCLDYQIVDVCIWMTCIPPFGCTFDSSLEVRHYLPDLVVSAYHNPGENPWPLVSTMIPDFLSLEGGDAAERSAGRDHTNLRFKCADAIGHPAVHALGPLLSLFPYHCTSPAQPFKPYFLSIFDFLAWRLGIPEMFYPESLNLLARVIGSMGSVWGHVYPREGFVIQYHDYKAGAVAAQRVADFVTRLAQPHVYQPLHAWSVPGYWPPGPVVEGKTSTHQWQRLQPDMSNGCHVFPGPIPFPARTADGDYVWALWRPYTCCERKGMTLIYH